MKKKLLKAFTLAELIITVGILGVVVLIVLFNVVGDQKHQTIARLNKAEAEIASILEMDYITHTGRSASFYSAENVYNLLVNQSDRAVNPQDAVNPSNKGGLKVAKDCSAGENLGQCWSPDADGNYFNFKFLLNDNTAVGLRNVTGENKAGGENVSEVYIGIDATGKKGPNKEDRDMRFYNLSVNNQTKTISLLRKNELPGYCLCGDGNACPGGNPKKCSSEAITNDDTTKPNIIANYNTNPNTITRDISDIVVNAVDASCTCANNEKCPFGDAARCPSDYYSAKCLCIDDDGEKYACPNGTTASCGIKTCYLANGKACSDENKDKREISDNSEKDVRCVCPNGRHCATLAECSGIAACYCANGSKCPTNEKGEPDISLCCRDFKCGTNYTAQQSTNGACSCVCATEDKNATYKSEYANNENISKTSPSFGNNCRYSYACKTGNNGNTSYKNESYLKETQSPKLENGCEYKYECSSVENSGYDKALNGYSKEKNARVKETQTQTAEPKNNCENKFKYECSSVENSGYDETINGYSNEKNARVKQTKTQTAAPKNNCENKFEYSCQSTAKEGYDTNLKAKSRVKETQTQKAAPVNKCVNKYEYSCKTTATSGYDKSKHNKNYVYQETQTQTAAPTNNCENKYSYSCKNLGPLYIVERCTSSGCLNRSLRNRVLVGVQAGILPVEMASKFNNNDWSFYKGGAEFCNASFHSSGALKEAWDHRAAAEGCGNRTMHKPSNTVDAFILTGDGTIVGTIPERGIGLSSNITNYNPGQQSNTSTNNCTGNCFNKNKKYTGTIKIDGCRYDIVGARMTDSPLVFDLEGDGLTTKDELIEYDINGDGDLEQINDSADAVLCFDRDKDGVCGKDGSEVFGNNTFFGFEDENFKGYADGFDALKALAKHEGLINDNDTTLDENDIKYLEEKWGLRIKKDGYLSKGEKLSDNKITSINTSNGEKKWYENFDDKGNDLMVQEGSSFVIDNKTNIFADIWHKIVNWASGVWDSITGE